MKTFDGVTTGVQVELQGLLIHNTVVVLYLLTLSSLVDMIKTLYNTRDRTRKNHPVQGWFFNSSWQYLLW